MVNKVLEILGARIYGPDSFVHNHHNFAWQETHFGEKLWVVRKGCTPAFPNQLGFIGANMFDYSVIVEGVESERSKQSLYTTIHGAGRSMSRTQAAGKFKGWGAKKVQVSPGLIDFDEVKEKMKGARIELRGAGADEAPGAYKKLEEVLRYQGADNIYDPQNAEPLKPTVRVLNRLLPIGVAMASSEVVDPYKD